MHTSLCVIKIEKLMEISTNSKCAFQISRANTRTCVFFDKNPKDGAGSIYFVFEC